MSFNNETKRMAFTRANGRCQSCGKQLVFENNGRFGLGCWEAHHINSNGADVLSNCKILCFDCHTKTRSFGRP